MPALAELLRGRWRLVEHLADGLANALVHAAPTPKVHRSHTSVRGREEPFPAPRGLALSRAESDNFDLGSRAQGLPRGWL